MLGFTLNGKYYVDIMPPFGCRTSALVCACTTRALVWLLYKEGFLKLCYLDDLVGIESMQQRACEAIHRFNVLADALDLALALGKCFPPSTNLTWLDFTIDTISMTVSIPQEKVHEVLAHCLE